MKNVMGGRNYVVNCIASPGYHVEQPGACEGSQSQCSAAATNWCNQNVSCQSCTLS